MRRVKNLALGVINTAIRLMILAVVVVYVYRTALGAYDFGYRIFAEEPMAYGEGYDVEITIPMGQNSLEVGEILQKHGLIRDNKLFFFQELLSAYHGHVQPGTYTLNTTMDATQMLAIMSADFEDPEEKSD